MVARPPPSAELIEAALAAFPAVGRPAPGDVKIRALAGGLINETFEVEAGGARYVLQRVAPIFAPEIHYNIVMVTERLAARGLVTPLLLRADDGRPWIDLADGGIWRLMSKIEGLTFHAARGPAQARSAGALVARFHAALAGLDAAFQAQRAGVHDTAAHLKTLEEALVSHKKHRLYDAVAELAERIVSGIEALPPLAELRVWVTHGDLKISNLLFSPGCSDEAICLVDLDTVGRMPLWQELGDAWRSWCNPAGEDVRAAFFDEALFAASWAGYVGAQGVALTAEERLSLVDAPTRIALELAARFAADALRERYFGWDHGRFAAAGEHNLLRAYGQASLAEAATLGRDRRAALLLAEPAR